MMTENNEVPNSTSEAAFDPNAAETAAMATDAPPSSQASTPPVQETQVETPYAQATGPLPPGAGVSATSPPTVERRGNVSPVPDATWWAKKRMIVGSVVAILVLALSMTGTAFLTATLVKSDISGGNFDMPGGGNGPGGRGNDNAPDLQPRQPDQLDRQDQQGPRNRQNPGSTNRGETDNQDGQASLIPDSSDAS